jgi:hypothetical protein
MKICGRRHPHYPQSQARKRLRAQGSLVELERAVEEIEFGHGAGYLPHSWACLLIARFARRDASRLGAVSVDAR